MGTKKKIGKQRRDKAYWAAKEIGYRSRASFKLIQLNRKWEFLQKSSVCIDLCAAPGSWMQVCRENMPVSSLVIGIDLSPIKPIPSCITMQEDITTEKCKQRIKGELKTAKADLVLHDGAPNVGGNWAQDSYSQALLTLSAFKLATVFLAKGGWFVTKVFRSKDYQALLWVFGQFFKKVHATKPAASRNESAEIFVVCQFYQAPDKIDPKFLDAKYVFGEIDKIEVASRKIMDPTKRKRNRDGYEDGVTTLFKEVKASEFVTKDNAIKILNHCNAIIIDKPWIENHTKTTANIKEYLKDLKVLNIKELRALKKWKDALKADLDKIAEDENDEAEAPTVEKTVEEIELEELNEIDRELAELKEEERRKEKRLKKKEKRAQEKRVERLNLKMVIPGDEGPRADDQEVFKLKLIREEADLNSLMDTEADMVASDDSDDEEKTGKAKFVRLNKDLEDGVTPPWYEEHDDVIEDSGSDAYESDMEPEPESLGLESDGEEQDDDIEEEEEPSHPIITKLSKDTKEEARKRKADMWFSKIGDLEDDSDLEDAEIGKAVLKVEDKGAVIKKKEKKVVETLESGYTSGSEDEDDQALDLPRKQSKKKSEESDSEDEESESDTESSDSESEDEKVRTKKKGKKGRKGKKGAKGADEEESADFEIVAQEPRRRKPLTAEQLALGEELVKSRKRKRDIMDEGWNRYMFNDVDLPSWFYEDEQKHYKYRRELDPAIVQKYKDREREMNVKTIKKVVEAKARKKRKVEKRMEAAKKKAAALLDNEDIGAREKAKEISKMYKAAQNAGKKKEVKYIVSKKARAGKGVGKQKGPYKMVDARMKKDSSSRRQAGGKKRAMKKRPLKGKQAHGSKQYGTQHKHS